MKHKPSIALVLGMGHPKMGDHDEPDGDEGPSEEMEYSDEQKVMAHEMMSAIKKGEPDDLLKAIHGIYESYKMMGSDEEHE